MVRTQASECSRLDGFAELFVSTPLPDFLRDSLAIAGGRSSNRSRCAIASATTSHRSDSLRMKACPTTVPAGLVLQIRCMRNADLRSGLWIDEDTSSVAIANTVTKGGTGSPDFSGGMPPMGGVRMLGSDVGASAHVPIAAKPRPSPGRRIPEKSAKWTAC
jgi:hypothetical protein